MDSPKTTGDRPSLRQWLAGQALAGILGDYGRVLDEDIAAEIAIEAMWCADATLKELAKKEQ